MTLFARRLSKYFESILKYRAEKYTLKNGKVEIILDTKEQASFVIYGTYPYRVDLFFEKH